MIRHRTRRRARGELKNGKQLQQRGGRVDAQQTSRAEILVVPSSAARAANKVNDEKVVEKAAISTRTGFRLLLNFLRQEIVLAVYLGLFLSTIVLSEYAEAIQQQQSSSDDIVLGEHVQNQQVEHHLPDVVLPGLLDAHLEEQEDRRSSDVAHDGSTTFADEAVSASDSITELALEESVSSPSGFEECDCEDEEEFPGEEQNHAPQGAAPVPGRRDRDQQSRSMLQLKRGGCCGRGRSRQPNRERRDADGGNADRPESSGSAGGGALPPGGARVSVHSAFNGECSGSMTQCWGQGANCPQFFDELSCVGPGGPKDRWTGWNCCKWTPGAEEQDAGAGGENYNAMQESLPLLPPAAAVGGAAAAMMPGAAMQYNPGVMDPNAQFAMQPGMQLQPPAGSNMIGGYNNANPTSAETYQYMQQQNLLDAHANPYATGAAGLANVGGYNAGMLAQPSVATPTPATLLCADSPGVCASWLRTSFGTACAQLPGNQLQCVDSGPKSKGLTTFGQPCCQLVAGPPASPAGAGSGGVAAGPQGLPPPAQAPPGTLSGYNACTFAVKEDGSRVCSTWWPKSNCEEFRDAESCLERKPNKIFTESQYTHCCVWHGSGAPPGPAAPTPPQQSAGSVLQDIGAVLGAAATAAKDGIVGTAGTSADDHGSANAGAPSSGVVPPLLPALPPGAAGPDDASNAATQAQPAPAVSSPAVGAPPPVAQQTPAAPPGAPQIAQPPQASVAATTTPPAGGQPAPEAVPPAVPPPPPQQPAAPTATTQAAPPTIHPTPDRPLTCKDDHKCSSFRDPAGKCPTFTDSVACLNMRSWDANRNNCCRWDSSP
ncbi:unnamed protein product [Amoebophrya sp. A120]|nr:unnamed protein product [Amoebophrya sp. A120]|eukprot:GSA120T00010710001.1